MAVVVEEKHEGREKLLPDSNLPALHVSIFSDLAAIDDLVRKAAVENLVKELMAVQKAFEMRDRELADVSLGEEVGKDNELDDCAPSLRYAVIRLIRGISSPREFARQGFALAFTLVLATIHSIKINSILKLIADEMEVSSSMKSQAKDNLFGRLFAYGAIARSGRLTRDWHLDKSTDNIKAFVDAVVHVAEKKQYLQEPAVHVILDLIEQGPKEVLVNHVLEAPGLIQWINKPSESPSANVLLLALKLLQKLPANIEKLSTILPSPFSLRSFFSVDYLSFLSEGLKESTFCHPRVHNVWPVLVNLLLPDYFMDSELEIPSSNYRRSSKKTRSLQGYQEERNNFRNFYEVIVENTLLQSSHERKHLALDLVLMFLPKLPVHMVPTVLSQKFVQCILDILSNKSSLLHKFAEHFLHQLRDWAENNEKRRVNVIVALQVHSNGKFDSITKTKMVKYLTEHVKAEWSCTLFILNVTNIFIDQHEPSHQSGASNNSVTDERSLEEMEDKDSLKAWVVNSVMSLLKCPDLDTDAQFRVRKDILKFLVVQGLFFSSLGSEVTSFELQEKLIWPKSAISVDICRCCIEHIQVLLSTAQKMETSRSSVSGREPDDLGAYFIRYLSILCNIPSVSFFRPLSHSDEEAFQKLLDMATQLSQLERSFGGGNNKEEMHAMRHLLIQLLLQVLLHPNEFSETAIEIIICCKKAFAIEEEDLHDSSIDEINTNNSPYYMDVLIDTLLSLLLHSSASMRFAVEQVFKQFCDRVTSYGLKRMLYIIKKDLKPARNHQFNTEDEENEEDEDYLRIEEDEDIDNGETESEKEAHAGGSEVAQEQSENSESGMDDEAMFRLDTHLQQLLKIKKDKAGGSTPQSQLVVFKLRVLSLIDIYLHELPGELVHFLTAIDIYSALARAFVNPHTMEVSEQLVHRIWGILQKKLFKAKEHPKCDDCHFSVLDPMLQKALRLATKPFKRRKKGTSDVSPKDSPLRKRYNMIVSFAEASTFWILKMIDRERVSEPELVRISELFTDVLCGKNSQIKTNFFKEIFRRWPWIGLNAFPSLLKKCRSTKPGFRRGQELDLLTEILKLLRSSVRGEEVSKTVLKHNIKKLTRLVTVLVKDKPGKASNRAPVHKFCVKVFQTVSCHHLSRSFVKNLESDAQATCESRFGVFFLNLKNS